MSGWRASAGGTTPTNTMNRQNVHNSEVCAEHAASKKHQIIKLGLDVPAGSIVVARQFDQSAPRKATVKTRSLRYEVPLEQNPESASVDRSQLRGAKVSFNPIVSPGPSARRVGYCLNPKSTRHDL